MAAVEKALAVDVLQSLQKANIKIQKFVNCMCSDDEEDWIVTYYFVRAGGAIDLIAEAGSDGEDTRCYLARSGSVISIKDAFDAQQGRGEV